MSKKTVDEADSLTALLRRRVTLGRQMDTLSDSFAEAYEEVNRIHGEINQKLDGRAPNYYPPPFLTKAGHAELVLRRLAASVARFSPGSLRDSIFGERTCDCLAEAYERDNEKIVDQANVPRLPQESPVDYIKRIGNKIHKLPEGV